MADETTRKELLSLTTEVAAQLEYLRELGVAHVAAPGGADVAAQTDATARASFVSSTPGDAYRSPALKRNAEAEARRAMAADRAVTHARTEPPPPTTNAAPPRPAGRAASASEQAEMATRKSSTRTSDVNPPAKMDTLFGEIAPQDELSLPRPGETLEDVWRDIGPQCMRCPLCCEGRKQVVNSEGNPRARLMFVGEAPGADEDAQARPFVGRAGQLLNKIIDAIGMKREDVFIGNVNRCRPSQNRTPTLAEAAVCKPFLLREIAIVRPDVIVVLGNTAMKNLLDTKEGITKLRGTFQDYKGIKVMPTFHPAYLLRDPSKKRETWDDMKKVRDYINTLKDKDED
ncbi:MAG: uracil-DNA glycosylase [Pyrinomonadaceae bacterium]